MRFVRLAHRLGALTCAALLLMVTVATGAESTMKPGDKIKVTKGPAPVKEGEKTLATVEVGTEVMVLSVQEPWVKVSVLRDGEKTVGWIHNRHLTPLTAPPSREPEGGAKDTKSGEQLTKPEIVRLGKAATALVELKNNKGYASSFCVHESGLFVTNDHVVQSVGSSETVTLVLNAAQPDQRVLKATVVRRDTELDLALLRAQDAKRMSSLRLGSAQDLNELMELIAFGYPFGKDLAPEKGAYPAISVNRGTITSLRRKEGELHRIQLDAMLNPGNSGGPLLDERGQVVGVVWGGIFGAGVSQAIPVSHLSRFLAKPDIQFSAPEISEANRAQPVTFQARVVRVMPDDRPVQLELILTGPEGQERKLPFKEVGGVYGVSAVPFPKSEQPALLTAVLEYSDGTIRGAMQDRTISVGGKAMPLRSIRRVVLDGESQVVLGDGSTVAGKIGGLDEVTVRLGGDWVTLKNVSRARLITLEPPAAEAEMTYAVVARSDNQELARLSGRLVVGSSGRGAPTRLQPPKLEAAKVERALPAPVTEIVAGGGGRFLLLQMPQLNKVAVFDVSLGKVSTTLPIPGDALIAAGAGKLVAVMPAHRLIQTWSLTSFEKEGTAPIPFNGCIKTIAMGCASEGPLLIFWSIGTGSLDQAHFTLLDVERFQPVVLKGLHQSAFGRSMGTQDNPGAVFRLQIASAYRDMVQMRASGTGDVFGLWRQGSSPMGLQSLILRGSTAEAREEHTTVGHVIPNFDGSVLCTIGSTYTADLRELHKVGGACLPSYHPSFLLSVPMLRLDGSSPGMAGPRKPPQGTAKPAPGAVLAADSGQPLVSLPELPEMEDVVTSQWRTDAPTPDKRFHFIPQANLLVTIPSSNDRLVLRQFDLRAELRKTGIEYLIVVSSPPPTARPGDVYQYQLEVESARGNVQYKLVRGPNQMQVSPTGRVTWRVPVGTEGDRHSVSIGISDASGQEKFHSFQIAVVQDMGPR